MVKINQRGITLIALVITIIVLLILAGVTINILLGQDGIINRTQQAKEQHEYAAAKEIIDLKLAEIYTDAVSNNEEYTMKKITTEMDKDTTITIEQKYFNTTASLKSGVSGSVDNLKGIVVSANQYSRFKFLVSGKNGSIQLLAYTTESVPDSWTTGDLPTGFIAIGESNQVTQPAGTLSAVETLLGYTGNTNSNDLQVGDHINYYYKDTNNETQHFECVVLYDKNSENGIQVVAADSVGSNIILGAGEYVVNGEDPKIPSSLASSSDFEKGKWSYNNAVSTLNSYADIYVTEGGMATGGRCVGSNPLPGHRDDAELNTMLTASNDPYDGNISDREWMTNNGRYNTFKLGDEYYSTDYNAMKNMTIPIHNLEKDYWLASRDIYVNAYYTNLLVRLVSSDGNVNSRNQLYVGTDKQYDGGMSNAFAFRPCFSLKSNIPVEKLN